MYSVKTWIVLLLAAGAAAQYNYPKPPKNTYLPPAAEKQVDSQSLAPEGEHEPGMPFDFTWAVKEDDGNDFNHKAQSNGDVVKGEYRTALPDGRTQIVKYTADWKNGYNAEIVYEGEAVYPEPPRRKPADNLAQSVSPPKQGYVYRKP